jgi:hypothetical protein
MGIEESPRLPLDLMTQSPETGNYRLGGIEMTPSEYAVALEINKILDEITDIKKRLSKLEKNRK